MVDHIVKEAGDDFAETVGNPFTGKYERHKFCLNVKDSGVINAYANVISGEITTELKILQLAENDSQVATFISHEMSHLLKSHSMDVTMPEYVASRPKKEKH